MPEDDIDDDWDVEAPPPVTAVAIRVEAAAVDAIRALAEPEGMTASELMRRWVLERLADERAPKPEPPPAPPPKKKAAPKKKAPAAKKKAAARKRT